MIRLLHFAALPLLFCMSCDAQKRSDDIADKASSFVNVAGDTIERIDLDDDVWAKRLSKEAFQVMRKHGTERPYSGIYADHHAKGVYTCAACDLTLFDAETKFESGTGWPSFYQPIDKTHVGEDRDVTLGMVRTEVHCNRCGGHLGHVFDDGPAPTGLRYCMNSVSLSFRPAGQK